MNQLFSFRNAYSAKTCSCVLRQDFYPFGLLNTAHGLRVARYSGTVKGLSPATFVQIYSP